MYVFSRAWKVSYEGLNTRSHGSDFHNSAPDTQKHRLRMFDFSTAIIPRFLLLYFILQSAM